MELLPALPSHLDELVRLPFHHKDPFDRLIIAQAMVERVPIISRGAAFELYGVGIIWKNFPK